MFSVLRFNYFLGVGVDSVEDQTLAASLDSVDGVCVKNYVFRLDRLDFVASFLRNLIPNL